MTVNRIVVFIMICAFVHITLQFSLQAEDSEEDDGFGGSISIYEDTIVVGAAYQDSNASTVNGDSTNNEMLFAGAAYVFVRTDEGWTQEAYLKPHNPAIMDHFGWAVDIHEDTIVVGSPARLQAPGAAYVFVRNSGIWTEEGYLTGSNETSRFGNSLSISGNFIVVGAYLESNRGAVYVFVRDGEEWTQGAYITSPDPADGDEFGYAVSISGERIVIGARQQDGIDELGAAYVYVRNETANSWDLEVTLKADSPEHFWFGQAVSISGDIIGVGATNENDDGAVYVYVRNETAWEKQTVLADGVGLDGNIFGFAVSVSSDIIIVGAIWENTGGSGFNNCTDENKIDYSGAAYVYETTSWSLIGCIKSPNPQKDDEFGGSVDVRDGTIVIANSHSSSFNGAYVYQSPISATGTTGTTGTTTGIGCKTTEFTGEEFVPRIISLSDESSCILITSSTEVCLNCINIRHPAENYFITTATAHSLPRGIYGCMITSCAKRNVEDSSEDLSSDVSRSLKSSPAKSKSLKTVASKSKSKSKSKSPDSSRSSSDSSDSSSDWLASFDLVIYVGVDNQEQQMYVDVPSTSTTQSTSNKNYGNLVEVAVIGLGLLVLGVALLSYWMKRKDTKTQEGSHLLTHNTYHSYN